MTDTNDASIACTLTAGAGAERVAWILNRPNVELAAPRAAARLAGLNANPADTIAIRCHARHRRRFRNQA